MPDDLTTALRAALPRGVVLGVADDGPLWPGEDLPGAVPRRLAEFTRGRSAARAAMRALGHPPQSVPVRADRSPQWPPGLTGSISHCDGVCLAILGQSVDWAGLGLDVEPAHPLPPDLWPAVLRPQEQATLPADCAGLAALSIFVAKEAAYKAQYAVTGTLFDFMTLQVTLHPTGFAATFAADIGPYAIGHTLTGTLVRTRRFTAAICAITAS